MKVNWFFLIGLFLSTTHLNSYVKFLNDSSDYISLVVYFKAGIGCNTARWYLAPRKSAEHKEGCQIREISAERMKKLGDKFEGTKKGYEQKNMNLRAGNGLFDDNIYVVFEDEGDKLKMTTQTLDVVASRLLEELLKRRGN